MTTENTAVTDAGKSAAWYYEANSNGRFDVFHNDERFNASLIKAGITPRPAQVLTNVTEAEAKAHVEMALRHERENAERQALVGHLFNKQNWKLPTKRETTKDLAKAGKMRDALAHFCGGAEIRCLSGGRYSVGSAGYYHYVGA